MGKKGLDMRIREARNGREVQGDFKERIMGVTRKTAIDLLIINYKESERGQLCHKCSLKS